jgi:hypothetical protein
MEDGRIVVGPRAMDAGDLVCYLYGGELAYVLRPKGDYFLFLGECFEQDLCDGSKHWFRNMGEWFHMI